MIPSSETRFARSRFDDFGIDSSFRLELFVTPGNNPMPDTGRQPDDPTTGLDAEAAVPFKFFMENKKTNKTRRIKIWHSV
jgi:hypothetical protein